jgi:hypothetical protein
MRELPNENRLAELLAHVTSTMLDIPVGLANGGGLQPDDGWRTSFMSIAGPQPLTLALSSDVEGCTRVAGAMFACPAEEVEPEMAEDALAELVNMTSGMLVRELALDRALCLPTTMGHGRFVALSNGIPWKRVSFAGGGIRLLLFLSRQQLDIEECR